MIVQSALVGVFIPALAADDGALKQGAGLVDVGKVTPKAADDERLSDLLLAGPREVERTLVVLGSVLLDDMLNIRDVGHEAEERPVREELGACVGQGEPGSAGREAGCPHDDVGLEPRPGGQRSGNVLGGERLASDDAVDVEADEHFAGARPVAHLVRNSEESLAAALDGPFDLANDRRQDLADVPGGGRVGMGSMMVGLPPVNLSSSSTHSHPKWEQAKAVYARILPSKNCAVGPPGDPMLR